MGGGEYNKKKENMSGYHGDGIPVSRAQTGRKANKKESDICNVAALLWQSTIQP